MLACAQHQLCVCVSVPVGPRPAREATDGGAALGDSFRAKNKDNVNILRFLAENLEKEQVSDCFLSVELCFIQLPSLYASD